MITILFRKRIQKNKGYYYWVLDLYLHHVYRFQSSIYVETLVYIKFYLISIN